MDQDEIRSRINQLLKERTSISCKDLLAALGCHAERIYNSSDIPQFEKFAVDINSVSDEGRDSSFLIPIPLKVHSHLDLTSFFLAHLPNHLFYAGRFKKYAEVLLSYSFLNQKVKDKSLGILNLIEDYSLAFGNDQIKYAIPKEKLQALKIIKEDVA